ncbi:MAG: PilZ domain-containing protein [Pseudomonadota bacterium]
MFNALLSYIQKAPQNDEIISRRRSPRRENDACICIVNGMPHPVENWSLGGVLIAADGRFFEERRNHHIILKFRLMRGILEIDLKATAVRVSRNRVAFAFRSLDKAAHNKFQQVIKNIAHS